MVTSVLVHNERKKTGLLFSFFLKKKIVVSALDSLDGDNEILLKEKVKKINQ